MAATPWTGVTDGGLTRIEGEIRESRHDQRTANRPVRGDLVGRSGLIETAGEIEAPRLDGPQHAPDSTESTKSADGSTAAAVLQVGRFSESPLTRGGLLMEAASGE